MDQKKFLGKTLDELQPVQRDVRSVRPLPRPRVMDRADVKDSNMPQTRQMIKLDELDIAVTGKGFCTALIDSGVGRHKDINSAIIKRISCNRDPKDVFDKLGHGTHIAGLIAGRGETIAGKGIANESMILSLKVTEGESGDASWFNIVKAFREIIERVKNWSPDEAMISVVNLSINGSDNLMRSQNIQNHKLIYYIEQLINEFNIPVVVSSGNNFERFRSYGVGYPAYHDHVISVGAVVNFPFDGYEMNTIAPFAQRIPPFSKNTPCFILAPGVLSVSLDITEPDGYGYMTGTSLAAPVVTGIILLMQESYMKGKPKEYQYLPPVDVLQKCLTEGGEKVLNTPHESTPQEKRSVYYDSLYYKRINAVQSIQKLMDYGA